MDIRPLANSTQLGADQEKIRVLLNKQLSKRKVRKRLKYGPSCLQRFSMQQRWDIKYWMDNDTNNAEQQYVTNVHILPAVIDSLQVPCSGL